MRGLSLGPLIEPRSVDDDLAVGRQFYVCAVHGSRGRPFEVDAFAVVAAAVARAFELIFAGLPIGRASQMRAACVDHEYAVRRAIHPDAIFLLELGVDAKRELRGIANLENGVGFKKSAGKKKPEEC